MMPLTVVGLRVGPLEGPELGATDGDLRIEECIFSPGGADRVKGLILLALTLVGALVGARVGE